MRFPFSTARDLRARDRAGGNFLRSLARLGHGGITDLAKTRIPYLQCPEPHSRPPAIAPPIASHFPALFVRVQNVPPFSSIL